MNDRNVLCEQFGEPDELVTESTALACLSGHLCGDDWAVERFRRTGTASSPHATYTRIATDADLDIDADSPVCRCDVCDDPITARRPGGRVVVSGIETWAHNDHAAGLDGILDVIDRHMTGEADPDEYRKAKERYAVLRASR